MELFNLEWDNSKKLSWNDLIDLILRKYGQFNIEQTDEVVIARILNSLSKVLKFKGLYQAKHERPDNSEGLILF